MSKERPAGPIRLKKSLAKQTKPGNWKDGNVADGMRSALLLSPTAVTDAVPRPQMTRRRNSAARALPCPRRAPT